MTLDEIIRRLTDLRQIVGGQSEIGLYPPVFYSDRPALATGVTIVDFKHHYYCDETKQHKVRTIHTGVVIK